MRVCGILAHGLAPRNERKHFLPQMRDPRYKNCPFASRYPQFKRGPPSLHLCRLKHAQNNKVHMIKCQCHQVWPDFG